MTWPIDYNVSRMGKKTPRKVIQRIAVVDLLDLASSGGPNATESKRPARFACYEPTPQLVW